MRRKNTSEFQVLRRSDQMGREAKEKKILKKLRMEREREEEGKGYERERKRTLSSKEFLEKKKGVSARNISSKRKDEESHVEWECFLE